MVGQSKSLKWKTLITFDSPGLMQMKYATLLLGDTDDQYGLEVGTSICVGSELVLDYLPVLCCLFWLCVCARVLLN